MSERIFKLWVSRFSDGGVRVWYREVVTAGVSADLTNLVS